MGQKLSVSLDDFWHPETAPRTDRPPTFDPLYGFSMGRKPREMKVTWEEMERFQLPEGLRDYCAHHAIEYLKCRRANAPLAAHYCYGRQHEWVNCQYEDHLHRMMEYEREKRLLMRKMRKDRAKQQMQQSA